MNKLLFAFLLYSAGALSAATITGLFNTGVDASGVPLVGVNVNDPHWAIISSPGAGVSNITPVTYFTAPYLGDQPSGTNGDSRWISVNAGGSNAISGTYIFELTFSLAGLDPATASITGRFAADNHATIRLNGTTVPGSTDTYFSYTNFSITSAFVPGTNKLDFVVVDDQNPTALRVDNIAGTATGGAVPEPGTLALILLGVGLVAAR